MITLAVLQKEIKRGCIDNAVLAAYEMVIISPNVVQHLWRRLRALARPPEQRAGDTEFSVDLAWTRPELLGTAGVYDLADYKAAVAEGTRPGSTGTVVLTSLPQAEAGA